MKRVVPALALLVAAACSTSGEDAPPAGGGGDAATGPGSVPDAGPAPPPPPPEAPPSPVEPAMLVAAEILGRPTPTSVDVSLVAAEPLEGYAEAGEAPGVYPTKTPTKALKANEPIVFHIDGLAPDKSWRYRIRLRRPSEASFRATAERSFRTRRAPGSTFSFTIQSDSHLDENSVLEQYRLTLANVLADDPDFHVDLGDTFMCDKKSAPMDPANVPAPDEPTVIARYLYERGNFGLVAHSVPLFLVNGNHEGETGFLLNQPGGFDLATWASRARARYYLPPIPDGFYSGDPFVEPNLGQRGAWYAFQWGDALFIALDPFWSITKKSSDGWGVTLGERQYRWLEQTLASSTAKYKFVFLHNLVGGLDGQMRGGVEAAPFFEWGGKELDGSDGFATKRPGWTAPIHDLLVQAKVSAVFHGHDHVYVKQELDGIVYQEVPQPSARNTSSGPSIAASYHYDTGTIVSSAGHLKVTVSPSKVDVAYMRSWLPKSETAQQKNRQVADSYSILPK